MSNVSIHPQALKITTELKHLSLKNNLIKKDALLALGHALEVNNTLQSLSLFGNGFEESTGKLFHSLIQSRLKVLDLKLDFQVYVVDGEYMIAEV
jgi:hypothetical protein